MSLRINWRLDTAAVAEAMDFCEDLCIILTCSCTTLSLASSRMYYKTDTWKTWTCSSGLLEEHTKCVDDLFCCQNSLCYLGTVGQRSLKRWLHVPYYLVIETSSVGINDLISSRKSSVLSPIEWNRPRGWPDRRRHTLLQLPAPHPPADPCL